MALNFSHLRKSQDHYIWRIWKSLSLESHFCDYGTFPKTSLWTWQIFLPEADHLQFLALQHIVLQPIVSSHPHLSHVIVPVSAPIPWVCLLILTFMPFLGTEAVLQRQREAHSIYWTLECSQLCKKITS